MRPINWYNPEQNVFGAIARAQDRGDVVAPFNVPPWLLGVAPGTPALPMPEAGQVSFRGNVRRPSYAQTVAATFGYGDAGACVCATPPEASGPGDAYEYVRAAFVDAAPDWGWDLSVINAQDWNNPQTVADSLALLAGMLAEYCKVPMAATSAALANAEFQIPDFNNALHTLVNQYCPQLAPAPTETTTTVGGDECPIGERMTEVPVYVNGRQVGTSMICAPLDRIVVPPGDEKEPNGTGEKKEEKNGYPVWGYYVAGGVGLLALGGVAYYATRKR